MILVLPHKAQFQLNYRKRWEIYKVDVNYITGEENLTAPANWNPPTSMQELAPNTHELAELVLQPRTLLYGIYKLKFFSRMWDTNDADPVFTRTLPFERVRIMYIISSF